MSRAYYNEFDPAAAHVLRCLIEDGVIAPGDVDERSIVDVEPGDIKGYTQAHFFAGGGLWSVAARNAGWADDRPIWSGSCPCQPFSVIGKKKGKSDERHLWPHFFRLIRACRPSVIVGEQVAGSAGYGWLDGVRTDLEGQNYSCRGVDIPACAIDAPHIRQRLYWVAKAENDWQEVVFSADCDEDGVCPKCGLYYDECGCPGPTQDEYEYKESNGILYARYVGDPECEGLERYTGDGCDSHKPGWFREGASGSVAAPGRRNRTFWSDAEWRKSPDGKARRVEPGSQLLVDGFSNRVAALRIAGNAVVPQLAAEVIAALMETL